MMINPTTREVISSIQESRLAEARAARASNVVRDRERQVRAWRLGSYRLVLTRECTPARPRMV